MKSVPVFSFLPPPGRQRGYAIGLILAVILVPVAPRKALGETGGFVVTELSGNDVTQVPCKLNNLGDVTGRADSVQGKIRATIWNRSNLKAKHFGALLGGDYSSGFDINDVGEIVGVSNTGSAMVPFFWTPRNGLQRVPLLRGDSCGQAIGINKYGHVAGYSSGPNGSRAFLWTRKGTVRNLGLLPGAQSNRAWDLNDSDEVVGTSASLEGERAVLWTKTDNVRDLGTLPGDSASAAAAINNNGDVVGYSKGPLGMRAFVWTKGGGMQELGILPGGDSSNAMDISDRGEVVGTSTGASGEHAFIWTKRTGIVDLNSAASAGLGVVFIEAHAINARGQILVMGKSAHDAGMSSAMGSGDNQVCAPAPPSSFLLTPAPTH